MVTNVSIFPAGRSAADQARVNRPILEDLGCEIVALVDDTLGLVSPFDGVPLLLGLEELCRWLQSEDISGLGFVIAIGNPYGHVRSALHDQMTDIPMVKSNFLGRN